MKVKFFLILCFALSLVLSVAVPVFAQVKTPTTQDQNFSNLDSNVPANLHTYSQSVVIEMLSAFSCFLTGVDPAHLNSPSCLGVDEKTGKMGYAEQNGGLVGMMGGALAMTFNIPINTHDYVAYTASNFGFAKKTYAITADQSTQSPGFAGLSPLLGVWQTFRNTVYILFTIIFVLIGLGIVLRLPIDNKTIMSVQNQIPRAVVVLALVTLSFAITGLMIDFMYVLIYMIYGLFASIPNMGIPSLNPASSFGHTPFEAINGISGLGSISQGASSVVGGVLGLVFSGTFGKIIVAFITATLGQQIGASIPGVGGILGGLVGGVAGGVAGYAFSGTIVKAVGFLIAFVIIAMAIVVALVRLWFILIKAYIFILVDTIIAPFWIGAGLIPHSPMGFGSWMRHLISQLLVFPVTFVFFMLAYVFIKAFSVPPTQNYFLPPFVGNLGDYHQLGPVIAFAIILMTSEIPNIIKEIVKTPDVKYSAAIGKGLGLGVSTGQTFAKPFKEKLWSFDEHGNAHGALNQMLASRDFVKNRLILRNLVGAKQPQTGDKDELGQRLGLIGQGKHTVWKGLPSGIKRRLNSDLSRKRDKEDGDDGTPVPGGGGGPGPGGGSPPAGGGGGPTFAAGPVSSSPGTEGARSRPEPFTAREHPEPAPHSGLVVSTRGNTIMSPEDYRAREKHKEGS